MIDIGKRRRGERGQRSFVDDARGIIGRIDLTRRHGGEGGETKIALL